MYKISVIMTVYNRESTVRGCIESVLSQDFHDFFELIIVNDGSQDGSDQIIREFTRDPRIKYLKTPNGGQAQALNLGLSQSKGDFVAFIDSDDEYYPHHLSTLYNCAKNEGVDFVLGSFDLIHHGDLHEVVDFYDNSKTIPVSQIECITGIIFGRREKIVELGGFHGDLLDIALFDKIKSQGHAWTKCFEKTYKYYFGRCGNNLSARIIGKTLTGSVINS